MKVCSIHEVIPEKNIIIFSPHFDDVLFMLGGYILELKKEGLLHTKHFHINILFSRSNYQAESGAGNFDSSPERIKLATGNRLIEDQDCLNELLGTFNYDYQLMGEEECFVRGKAMADSEMKFPHGMYEDFSQADLLIFERMKQRIRQRATQGDTALIFPLAICEHIDHFIVREAALNIARELGEKARARFYFQEDKPYGGIATVEELVRIEDFIRTNNLECRFFIYDLEQIIELAFRHYISQVEDVYKKGILERARYWQQQIKSTHPVDRICLYHLSI